MLVLEEMYRSKKNEHSKPFNLRIQRSLSWFKKALILHDDLDLQFITVWVAFNALDLLRKSLLKIYPVYQCSD